MNGHDHDGDQSKDNGRGQHDAGGSALVYWRLLPANRFGAVERQSLLACISCISSTSDEWRRAIRGDAVAAIDLALRLGAPSTASYRVDLAMTLLTRAGLDDAAASTAMAERLGAMPLNLRKRSKLATSWLLHAIWLDSRRQQRSLDGDRPAATGSDPQ